MVVTSNQLRHLLLCPGFFSQFGDVKRLKVSRSKKTGNSKHYAFVEFRSSQVAAIAADAMNGYMMFTQKLDCHVLPASKVHPELFKGANRAFKRIPWSAIEQKRHNKPRTVKEQVKVSLAFTKKIKDCVHHPTGFSEIFLQAQVD